MYLHLIIPPTISETPFTITCYIHFVTGSYPFLTGLENLLTGVKIQLKRALFEILVKTGNCAKTGMLPEFIAVLYLFFKNAHKML